jgi:hypothetical protein
MSATPESQADGRTSGQSAVSVHLSISDAAARLDTTPRNVRRWIAEGRLDAEPDPKGGRGRVVSLESVRAWEVERDAEKQATRTSGRTDTRTNPAVRPPVHEEKSDFETLSGGRGELVEQLRGEVDFLRARNAELNAIVMQQARALSSFGAGREIAALDEAPGAAERSEMPEKQRKTPEPTETPARPLARKIGAFPSRKEARPLWQVVLGIRPKGTKR